LHKMLCGSFSESKGKKLKLKDVDGGIFLKALDVWCGREDCRELEWGELQRLANVADRFQMTDVLSVLEEALMGQLSVDMCGDVLMWSGCCGMGQLEAEALRMASWRFEEFATTAGFMRMGEEALMSVVDDDQLVASNEEAVWEAVVGGMRGAGNERRGRGVAGRVRFPLMEEEYLRCRVVGMMMDGEHREWMACVVAEALRAQAALREGAAFDVALLGRKALAARAGPGVRWEECRDGGGLRLRGPKDDAVEMLADMQRVFGWVVGDSDAEQAIGRA
jgi:hypothetical protein